jgi:hypothetical protein
LLTKQLWNWLKIRSDSGQFIYSLLKFLHLFKTFRSSFGRVGMFLLFYH